MNTKITKKINNTDYAPGIATYGNSGITGEKGNDGNCIYYTSFNIKSGEDLPAFKKAIREGKLPIKNGATINRPFKNGDYFFDKFGNIFVLYNIDDLKNHPNLGNNYLRFFKDVGTILQSNSAENIFSFTENTYRMSLNANYTGLEINSSENELIEQIGSENFPLKIISNNLNGDNIELLNMTAFHNYEQMPDFKIYYDTVNNVWHLNSDIPIVIDSELSVNREKNEALNLEEYSPVIINDTPITVFYNYCRNIKWAINGSNGFQLINFPKFPDNMKNNMLVKVLLVDEYNSGKTLFIKVTDKYWDKTMKYVGNFNSTNIKQISLIHNIEVIIDKKEVPDLYLTKEYNIDDIEILKKLNLDDIKVLLESIPQGVANQNYYKN